MFRCAASSRSRRDLFDSFSTLYASSSNPSSSLVLARGVAHSSSSSLHATSSTRLPPQTKWAKNRAASPRLRKDINASQDAASVAPKRLLQPYELSQRVNKLVDEEGLLDEAIDMVQNSPHDAQNIKVWNNLITKCTKAKRYKVAWSLFVDLKRRGFVPNIRTYNALFRGYVAIKDWSIFSVQLDNVHSLYEQYKRHVKSLTQEDDEFNDADEDNLDPIFSAHAYISILKQTEQYQKAFDIFHDLDPDGPFSPDQRIFATMFAMVHVRAVAHRTQGDDSLTLDLSAAKYLWKRLTRVAMKKGDQIIDHYIIDPFLRTLSMGSLSDQALAFDIVHDYLGLGGIPDKPPPPPRIGLRDGPPVQIALRLCYVAQKYELCLYMAQQIMDDPKRRYILASPQTLEVVLRAHRALASAGHTEHSRKAVELLNWVAAKHRLEVLDRVGSMALEVCWICKDWASAEKVFELVTGNSIAAASSQKGGNPTVRYLLKARGPTPLSFEEWITLFRIALATSERANIRQCLRMLDRFGGRTLRYLELDWKSTHAYIQGAASSPIQFGREKKLAELVAKAVLFALRPDAKDSSESVDKETRTRWTALRNSVDRYFERVNLGLLATKKKKPQEVVQDVPVGEAR
ncbi:hypothetical protein EW146_g1453 [Bondarzewia mesenterica]|uniref:Pentacotripeptide-repeat region of PRORP domain-containing protein n=1 Tax=Bondarzewia mesenterica TaxID=1095465 RepID=A0A4S4M582_9AGAM|nr:hypothetical protein EW146_g1453 [Bondarzewia mesenterica]